MSDDPAQFSPGDLPVGVSIHPREEMDSVQRELREISGVSVLIYQQTCATEKRRRRKRGQMADPKRFAYINDLVCEGCGDCSVESNCLSVEPKETPFGRKRQINLSSCNKDFSCLNGFCPSFVTVEGATRRKKSASQIDAVGHAATLPLPAPATLDRPYDLLITGVGGTGVITVGALIGMAAHLERHGVSVLDFTGFAQKFGPVLSYIRLAATPEALHQVRIDQGAADALIGCDLVVSSSPKASGTYRKGTRAAVNTAEMPTGDVVRFRDADLASPARLRAIGQVIGDGNLDTINANALAERLLGDAVYANIIMLGFAWQRGLLPVSLPALLRAIELNGVAVERNKQAFAWGRIAAADPDFLPKTDEAPKAETLDQLINRRADFLTAYQDDAYAARYRALVAKVRNAEANLNSEALTEAVARALFKLMAYKDEYEVARLHMQGGFLDELKGEFEGDFSIQYHLAPPFLPSKARRPRTSAQARLRAVDPDAACHAGAVEGIARDAVRSVRLHRGTARRAGADHLVRWHHRTDARRARRGASANLVAIAKAPMDIRGYGPVKDAAIGKVKAEVERLFAELDAPSPAKMRAHG